MKINFIKKINNKITLLDKILILSAVLTVAFFGYVFFRKSDYVVITMKVGEDTPVFGDWVDKQGQRPWFTEFVQGEIKQSDRFGRVGAEIVSVNSYDTMPGRKALYIKVRLRAIYDNGTQQYVYNGLPVTIGSIVRVSFSTISVDGLVTNIEGLTDVRKKVRLTVTAKMEEEYHVGVPKYLSDQVSIGDEVKDGEGNAIIKVTDKKVEDADTFVVDYLGRVFVRKNPLKKDVYLTLDINAIQVGNRYYLFDDMPILVGNTIPYNTTTFSFFPIVTNITLNE